MTQCEIILKAMLENKDKKEWDARDFQSGKYFVGYEATARMSELVREHPKVLIVGKNGRFRTLQIDWEQEETKELLNKFNLN